MIGVFSTFFGYSIIDLLSPDVSFENTRPMNFPNSYLSIFELRNNSRLPIYNIDIVVMIDSMHMTNGSVAIKTQVTNMFPHLKKLESRQTSSGVYNMVIGPAKGYYTNYARMAFVVSYDFLWIRRRTMSFYQCAVDGQKNVAWIKDLPQNYVHEYPFLLER